MGNFKNLRVWQEAILLAADIYALSNQPPFSKDFNLCDQIRRSVISVSSNIAEGEERGSKKESVYFFNIAKGSIAETISQLHIARKIGYIEATTFKRLEDRAEKVRASLKNLIKARKARVGS